MRKLVVRGLTVVLVLAGIVGVASARTEVPTHRAIDKACVMKCEIDGVKCVKENKANCLKHEETCRKACDPKR